jgi:hypothetical protein
LLLGAVILLAGVRLANAPASPGLMLAWDYPYDRDDIVFEVWETYDLSTWFLADTIPDLTWPIDTTKAPAAFFKVRAKDTETGEVSKWAN